MATGLEEEVATFEAKRAELLGAHKGKFALVKTDKLIDVFDSQQDALKRGYELFGNVPFLVKQILEVDIPSNFTSFMVGA